MAESHSARQRREQQREARRRARAYDEARRAVQNGRSYTPARSRSHHYEAEQRPHRPYGGKAPF